MAFGVSGILVIALVIGVLVLVVRLTSGAIRAVGTRPAKLFCPHCRTETNVVHGTCQSCGDDV